MAQEDKLKEAKRLYQTANADQKYVLERLFPELKESEDERMIQYFKDLAPFDKADELYEKYGFSHKDAIAWLEKQGEHADFRNKIQIGDRVTRNEDGVLVNLSQLNRVAKKDEKQGGQKPADKVESKFKVGDEIKTANEESLTITKIDEKGYWSEDLFICGFDEECIWDLVEQKPWSEEDEDIINKILCICDDFAKSFEISPLSTKVIKEDVDKIDNWLKSLKGRVQPKQEWSEDGWTMQDEEELQIALDTLVKAGQHSSAKWLKNVCLRPQTTWKPSDEQMKTLEYYAKLPDHSKVLLMLYNDLKKLTE